MQEGISRKLFSELSRYECQDSTFHRMAHPVVVDRALESMIWDVDGNEYIDWCAGFGALPLGHNDPVIMAAVRERLAGERPAIIHGLGDVFPAVDKIKLLEAIHQVVPRRYTKTALAVTGAQAVELAMKTAILATSGSGFIAFSSAYHGLDFGALGVTGMTLFKEPFGRWGINPAVSHLAFGASMETIANEIDAQMRSGIKTAGIIVEPIQGRGGIRIAPDGWLVEIAALCKAKGIVFILDEVFSGLGRTGRWTAAEVVPADLICLGKTLGGGMPLSACVGTDEAMGAWPVSQGEALHTGTFFGHPLSCYFAHHTLSEMVERQVVQKVQAKGERLQAWLSERLAGSIKCKEIRGMGLMVAVEGRSPGDGVKLMEALQLDGVLAIPAGVHGECLSLTPALNISDELIKISATKIASACSRL